MRRDRGWPMPPPAPRTATLEAWNKSTVSKVMAPKVQGRLDSREISHLAGRRGEGPLLEEIEGLASSKHGGWDG